MNQTNFEEFTDKQNTFSFSVLYKKAEKHQNTVFGYKKGSKSKIKMISEIFGRYLYKSFGIIYRNRSILKDLARKVYFSLVFYTEKLKNNKIHFLVTKIGQKLNLMTFSDARPENYIYFISTFP